MPKSTITSKGQTTIPREVRESLAVGPGDALNWELVGNTVRISVSHRAFLRRRGAICVGRGSTAQDIHRARAQRGAGQA
jgi:AbrB family looped-hinge helix DNA binding protein